MKGKGEKLCAVLSQVRTKAGEIAFNMDSAIKQERNNKAG